MQASTSYPLAERGMALPEVIPPDLSSEFLLYSIRNHSTVDILQTDAFRSELMAMNTTSNVTGQEVINAFTSPNPLAVNFEHLEKAGSGYISGAQAQARLNELRGRAQGLFPGDSDAARYGQAGWMKHQILGDVIKETAAELARLYPKEARNIDRLAETMQYKIDRGESLNPIIATGVAGHALIQLLDCVTTAELALTRSLQGLGSIQEVDAVQGMYGLVYAATQPIGPVQRLANTGSGALQVIWGAFEGKIGKGRT